MNKMIFILILFNIYLFQPCVNHPQEDLKNEDLKVSYIQDVKEISFPLDSTKDGKPLDYETSFKRIFQYCFINDIETLIIPINKDRLAFYDLNTFKEYHSVPLSRDRNISNFSYVNKDSIFVFYDVNKISYSTYEPLYIQLIDYNGNLTNCDFNIDTLNFNDNTELRLPFIMESNLHPTIIDGNVFFMTQTSGINNIGTSEYQNKFVPLFAYYSSKTKKIKTSAKIMFPHIKEGIFYNTNYKKLNYCTSSNDLPLIRFFYSSTLFEWNYKADMITSHTLKSKIIDSIQPLANQNSLPESLEAVYGSIFYDKYNKIYYSFLHLNQVLYGNYYTLLILADENFNYLGEVLNPKLGGNIQFYRDNIITYYYSNDSIHVKFKKLKKTDMPLQPYLDSIKGVLREQSQNIKQSMPKINMEGNALQSFIQYKFPKIEKNYVLLTLYAGSGCPSCTVEIKELLNENYMILRNLPFYFIYSGTTSEMTDISKYKNLDKLKIVRDSLGIVKNISIIENKFNSLDPRLIVVKNNEVVLDTVYNWKNIQSNLIPTMMSNLGLKQ